MGCDIHVYVEFKIWYGENKDKWFDGDHYRFNPFFGSDEYEKKMEIVPIYDGRNYSLFSVLAGVRNYGGNIPISEPKGIPEDCCEQIKTECESWDCDGHSHSYFTLKELLDYQKVQPPIKHSGYITKEASELLDNGVKPESWWQGGNIDGQVWREWEEPDSSLKPFIDVFIEREKEIFWIFSDKPEDIEKRAEEIRTVFWFDN